MKKSIEFTQKNIPKYIATVLNQEHKELYKEAFTKIAEKFGEDSLAYKSITNGIDKEDITGSNFFFVNQLNKFLPDNQKILTLEDIDNILTKDPKFFNNFYTDTNQLILRSFEATWDKNQPILNYLKKQLKGYEVSPENPLLITNPELIKANDGYGLKIKIGNDTKVENDKGFAPTKNTIQLGNLEKTLWTKENGLSWLYLGRSRDLYSNHGSLSGSNDYGRVVAVSAAGDTKI